MVAKDQAANLPHGAELHYGECHRFMGKRGGIKERIIRLRVNGKCNTSKRHPEQFQLPLKFGLYGHSYLNQYNSKEFHLAEDCPLCK